MACTCTLHTNQEINYLARKEINVVSGAYYYPRREA